LFHDIHIGLSDFEPGSGEILSEIIGSTSRYLHDFIGSIAFYLLHAEYLLLQGRELCHYLSDEVYLVPLLCPPVFYGYFHYLVGGEVPPLMSALVIKLVAHDGNGERLEVIFCLDILAHVPQPEHDFLHEVFGIVVTLSQP
jgi:hypothetical protein